MSDPAPPPLHPAPATAACDDDDDALSLRLSALVHAWGQALPDEQTAALQRLMQESGAQGEKLRTLAPIAMQQLITQTLQASLQLAALPSAAAAQAHAQRLLLDRLWRILTGVPALPPTVRSIELLEAVVAAHTPAPGAASSGASLSNRDTRQQHAAGSAASLGAGSRRGSLSQPLEEKAVASTRQHAFKFAFEYVQAQARAASNQTPPLFASPELRSAVSSLYVLGVSDVWSAIRKTAATALARSPLVAHLPDAELQQLFDSLLDLALTHSQWQVQEGAVLGLSSLLTALRQRQAVEPARALPAFLSTAPSRFFPLLAHAQLTVREYACNVLRGFVDLFPAEQSAQLKHDLLRTLMDKLSGGEAASSDNAPLLSDYESEGILNVFHALGLPVVEAYLAVLDRYLGHPASSVRQLVADVLARLATGSASSSASFDETDVASSNTFDLPAFLAHEWEWSQCEMEAALTARASHLADVHTAAVFFVLPPPLSVAPSVVTAVASQSRRGSLSLSKPGSPVVEAEEQPAVAAQSAPRHRSSWQWKEGALMCLELYLRFIAPVLASSFPPPPAYSRILPSLGKLFPQVVRAASSWSWELRRMAEQVRHPFLAVWLHWAPQGEDHAGTQIVRLCQEWMEIDSTSSSLSPTTSGQEKQQHGAHAVPLSSAVSTVICLKYVLSHMQRVQAAATKRDAAHAAEVRSKSVAENEESTERKWQHDGEDLSVDPAVLAWFARFLPLLLTRLEQVMVSAQLSVDHAALGTPSLSASPTLDNLSAVRSSFPPTSLTSVPPLVSWEQFITLGVEVCVAAYALQYTPAAAAIHARHVSEQSKLQHYQCVLDRLRTVRSLCIGEEQPPAISVAAQMPSVPPSPNAATRALTMLPSFGAVVVTPAAVAPPSATLTKVAALQRTRAKRLELWILTHVSASLPAFTNSVPAAAHIDLLALLQDYLSRYHTSAADVRASLLKAFSIGWLRIAEVHQPLWSHQLHQLQETSVTMLLQLLSEHAGDRALIVSTLSALITSTPVHTTQLREVLNGIAALVPDEYLLVLLDSPPPPPSTLLSPTSAAIAAETEAWDDWDEDGGDGASSAPAAGAGAGARAYDTYIHARQLVLDLAPLLVLLESQPFVAQAASMPLLHPHAHAQSSLERLVRAYDAESAGAAPNAQRQVELLQWIQQWASQVQQRVQAQAHTDASSESNGAAAPVRVSVPTTSANQGYTSQRCMPLNAPLDETLLNMDAAARAKITWIQTQGRAQNAAPAV